MNDVSVFCNSEVISTSGFTAMLILGVENMSPLSLEVKCCCLAIEPIFWNDVVITETGKVITASVLVRYLNIH